jgi:outer membrane receptor protein involved in Fe transport
MLAGNTGKIAGVVKDGQTGEPLVGANVIIEGTTQGAATNIDGYYVILNIPPGKYALSASTLGYTKSTVSNVSVSIDLTTTIDFQLSSTVLVGEEIVITAQRPLIQKDLTAKTAVVGGDDIRALPVTEVGQVLSLQAGFVNGSLRGGRSGEVAYWIDGVPVTDAYNGSQVVEVNKDLVQELQVISGAYNAEYGQALSGIVNIATKEGRQKFTGSVGFYGGDYISSHTDIFPGIDKASPTAVRNIEGSVSGPVLGEDLTFFANGRYIYFDGHLSGFRRFNPQNLPAVDSTGRFRLYRDAEGRGDSDRVPMDWSERKYGQGKLTWHVTPVIKANLNFIYDNTDAKGDDNLGRGYVQDYYYNPDGIGTNHSKSNTTILQVTHSVSDRTFYTLGASYFDKSYKYYVYEDPHDPRYVHPDLLTSLNSYSFKFGGTDLNRFDRSTKTFLGKLDISSQLDEVNLVKIGVEYRNHKLGYEKFTLQPILSQVAFDPIRGNPFITTTIPSDTSNFYDAYTHRPFELSAYIQDKLEFKDFILNIGLRFDYFEPDGVVLNDDQNTYGLPYAPYYTVDDPNIYSPIKDFNKAKSLAERRTYWYKKAKAKYQFSPRIGASFPITDRGVFHFSYGHFFQIPRFERLYENPDFKLGFGTGNQGLIGNADLKPEQTINGEIGIQQQITDDISVDLTAYIRDIRNLTSTGGDEIFVFGQSAKYSKYVNRDFGYVRGIVITVDKNFSQGLSATLDYTFQIARTTASDPGESRNSILGGSLPEVQLTPLDKDQRHTLNVSINYSASTWGASCIAQYGSGTPFTPRKSTDITTLLTNSQNKPEFFNLDARAYYEVPFGMLKLVAFLRVFNLLDIENEVNVFNDTGRAGFTTDLAKARKENPPQLVNTFEEFFRRPAYYSEPRRIEFGMNLEF